MTSLTVPASGLTLTGTHSSHVQMDPTKPDSKPPQVLQLDLAPGVLEEVMKSVANGGKGVHISFGKVTTLHYGNKAQQLLTTPLSSQTELYTHSTEPAAELAFAGLLSHKLAMKQAQDNLAGTDAALAMLQSRMASHRKDKQSKQIVFVPDGANLPPPIQEKQATIKSNSLLKKNNNTSRLINNTTRSMPSSPAITASRSAAALSVAPTSVPVVRDEKTQKFQALRTPLVHLLAVRQVSVKFLAQKICCSQEECREVLGKVGRESLLDPSKWDLSDKSFKELDVWKFPYPTEGDRKFAIDRAVSAFDRMRVSREENFWQMLLPKSERGKGKILSKLNLHSGPIQKSGTPRINFQPTSGLNEGGHETGQDSDRKDRLSPSNMVRSKSNEQITKKKVSEKEAQSKRLLSKNPKKAAQVSKPRETPSAVKKGAKKAAAASSSIPKSTEFVRDSDEDEEMMDVVPQSKAAPSKPAANEVKKANEMKRAPKPSATKPLGSSVKPKVPEVKGGRIQKKASAPLSKAVGNKTLPSGSSNSGSRNRGLDASQGSIPMTKSLSRQRTTSSPHKPSPLGSSPPTNASDFDNDGHSHHASSTSSTPLVAQSRKTTHTAAAPLPANSRPAQAAQNTDNSLKRKANDIDSDIHSHNAPSTNSQTSSTKRQKSSTVSPPTSESSNSTSGVIIGNSTIVAAQRFKTFYAKYEKLYQEVTGSADPPKDKVDSVLKMHDRLVTMKDEIAKGLFVE